MRRVLRWALRLTVVVLVLISIAVVAFLYWARQDSSRVWIASNVSTLLSDILAGDIRIARIDGSLWRDLHLTDISVHYEDKEVLTVASLHARFRLDPLTLLRGDIRIADIDIDGAVIDARLAEDGSIDLVEAFLPIEEEESEEVTSDGTAITVLLNRIDITNGTLHFAGLLDEPLELRDFTTNGKVEVWPDGVDVQLESLAGQLLAPGVPEMAMQAQVRYADRDPPATITVGPIELRTADSAIDLAAVLRDARGDFSNLHIDGRIELAPLAPSDLARLAGDWPATAPVAGRISVQGDLDVLRVDGELTLGREPLLVGGRLDLAASPLQFDAGIRTPGFALATVAEEFAIGGTLSGSVHASGPVDDPDAIAASAELEVDGLTWDNQDLGHAIVEARLRDAAALVNAELTGKAGTVAAYGRASIGDTPTFTADLYLGNVDAAQMGLGTTATAVNLVARVTGSGATADDIDADAVVYLAPSVVGGVDLDVGVVRSRFSGNRLVLSEGHVAAGRSRLRVDGNLDFTPDAPSQLSATLVIPRLELDATASRIGGGGSVLADATLDGPLRTPHVRATVEVENLATGSLDFRRGNVNLDASIDAAGLATGTVSLQIDDVTVPTALDVVTAQIDLQANEAAQGFSLALDAEDPKHGTHTARLDGVLGAARSRLTLQRLRVGTTYGEWQLAAPATLTLNDGSANLTSLKIASEVGVIEARADVPARGEVDVVASLSGVDIAFLTSTAPRNARLGGILTTTLAGRGAVDAPVIDVRSAIEEVTIGGQSRGRMTAVAQFRDERVTLDARFDQDESHWLRAEASLPAVFSANAPSDAKVTGPLQARIHSPGLLLDFLRPFTGPDIRNLGGILTAEIRVDGPLEAPDVVGEIAISEGTARLQPLRVTVKDFTLRASHEPGLLRIHELRAGAEDGRFSGTGEMTLTGYAPDTFDIRIEARNWPAIRTPRYQADVGGDLSLAGNLQAPVLGGKIIVEKAFLRPDLRFLDSSAGPAERDPTIVVVDTSKPSFDLPVAVAAPADSAFVPERVAADVRLEIRRGTRVRHEMADIELTGNLRLRQQPGGTPVVTGKVETVRGWIEIQGREFTLDRGEVTFTGGPVENPSLAIRARHRRPPYIVEAFIGGSVEEPSLELSSEPALDQADILAVLLFGRPMSKLDEGEKTTLQQQALSVTSGYAAGVLGQAVSDALGLENLGIDLRNVDFTGGTVGFGRYITPNTYVSVTQDLSEQRGRGVSVEYFLTPTWKILTSTDSLGTSGIDIIWQTLY